MGAEAAISTVVQLLAEFVKEKVDFLRGVKAQVGLLKDELKSMQSFLIDANRKQAKNELVRTWIEDIRKLAHDTEDTIEMFNVNVEISKSRGLLKRWAYSPNRLRHLDEIGNEITWLLARLDAIDKRRMRYGIVALSLGESSSRSEVEGSRRLDLWHKDEHLVGMEDDVENLVGLITDEEKKGLYTAAVVGMGGIGKSTLAREIYNHPRIVSGRFDCRAWVVVSSKFTPHETIKQLVLELNSSEKLLEEIKKLEELTRDLQHLERKLREMLRKELEEKTYFIVLDDVWEKKHLELFMPIFPNKDKTSRLLLTSRHNDIGDQCQFSHHMGTLNSDMSWKLFKKKVLTRGNSNGGLITEKLEKIGRKIVQKCEGLPLSITVMGGLLAEKCLDEEEWKEAQNELDSLPIAKDSVASIVEISYQNLSPELKCCFLCLAYFKEDATIPVKRVINIMVGQGLIQHTGRTKAEEAIARDYLDKLINRNLVQIKDLTFDGRVKSCRLHDSLRKLCLEEAQKEIGLENLIGDRRVSLEEPRHKVVYCDDLEKDLTSGYSKHIRSIFMLNVNEGVFKALKSSYWKRFQLLKTLDLEVNYPMPRLPDSFRFLLGLKQLRIHATNLQQSLELPTWLNKFKKLEILDMMSARVVFPKVALEMDRLRHINARYIERVKIGNSCKNLESLKYITQRDWMKCNLREREDSHFRKLGIVMDDQSTMGASLEKLKNLDKLVLWFSGPPIDLVSISCLGNLTRIKLWGSMRKCVFPPNLSHLTLEKSELDEDSMQELGKLQKLLYLKLKCDSYYSEIIIVSQDSFPRLKGLHLRELYDLREVVIEEGGMPQLKVLQVRDCHALYTKNLSNKSYQLQIQTLNSKVVDNEVEAETSFLVKRLGDLLIQKDNILQGVESQVRLLKDKLTTMQPFFRDANKKQARDEGVRNWISEIREVVQDAEDAIEMFILNAEDPRKSRGLFESCVCFPSHLSNVEGIRQKIESIHARLVEIDKRRERYGIKDLEELGEPIGRLEVKAGCRLAPWLKGEDMVGVEENMMTLIEIIMDQEKKGFYLAAVVGMGGIGKSTLAQKVYNHININSSRFNCRAWVVVSSEFTPLETIKQLIVQTTTSDQQQQQLGEEIKNLEESTSDKLYLESKLKELLHKQLKEKTYFIVLDDVWEREHFRSLLTAFPKEQDKTSRLLITTRDIGIADQCQIAYLMKFLDSKTSWELFLQKALVNSSEAFPNELEHIGRQIVEKCEGLPLAITVMGGLLAQIRFNKDEWQEALNQLDSHLVRAQNSISAIMEFSYQNLSRQLRSCFLCFAFFKEDATIPLKRLVNIMVGRGLVRQKRRTKVEEIVRGYLNILINLNMIQVRELTLDNGVKSCHLHDLLRDLCLHKAEEEIGLENRMEKRRISLLKPQHRVVNWNDLGSFSMDKNRRIYSLLLHNVRDDIGDTKSSYWKGFQYLKTLDLSNYPALSKLPDAFQVLVGLKQLIIGKQNLSGPVLELPSWLNTLKKLELLEMPSKLVESPNVALEMDSLLCFHAKRIKRLMITDSWKNIETLKYIMHKDWMRGSLRQMDDCRMEELGMVLDDESRSVSTSLEKLVNLGKLYLEWDHRRQIDAAIIPPLGNLTKLKLRGEMSNCPSASVFPPNLSHLTLENSHLDEDPMEELGKLPVLLYLKLKENSYMGKRMQVSHDAFPSLRGLSLQHWDELRSFEVEEGGMPQPKLLQVDCCPCLNTNNLSGKSYKLHIGTITEV